MLLDEVDNIENWLHETRIRIMRPNTMNAYGSVLDDFGLETMLAKLMEDFILPMSTIFFPEIGGATLESHHGYIVEYGTDRDDHLGNWHLFTCPWTCCSSSWSSSSWCSIHHIWAQSQYAVSKSCC